MDLRKDNEVQWAFSEATKYWNKKCGLPNIETNYENHFNSFVKIINGGLIVTLNSCYLKKNIFLVFDCMDINHAFITSTEISIHIKWHIL